MPLEFIFAEQDKFDPKNLQQGDVLKRNDELAGVLSQAHHYYATAPDYTHFMVLTQSCDLVLRRGKAKSRYVTLAAIRPLGLVVDELISKYSYDGFSFPIPICDKKQEAFVKQVLERLLHNTMDGLFFIKKDSHPMINKDLCVFLPLSIALRIDHYQECLDSKIAQLNDIFQAKLGWLVGNQYSRVGTPDIEEFESNPEEIKKEFLQDIIYNHSAWLTPAQLSNLKQRCKDWSNSNPGDDLDMVAATEILDGVPDVIELVSNRVVQKLVENEFISGDSDAQERAKKLIINDKFIKQIVRHHN